jgi:excisionase family DNA binding protein
MYVSITEVAPLLGVSPRRARAKAASGALAADRVGGRWLVRSEDVRLARPAVARPLSKRNSWGLIDVSNGRRPAWARPQDVYHLRGLLARLLAADDPAALLRSWMPVRAQRLVLSSWKPGSLANDPRVAASGISDDRSGMSGIRRFEGYVKESDARDVVARHVLAKASLSEANVILHVVDDVSMPEAPVPLLLVAADLADYADSAFREDNQARAVLGRIDYDR